MSVEDKFHINLNQNVWGLVVAYLALGAAERYELKWLFRVSVALSIALTISVSVTSGFYTWRYCKKRFQ